MVIDVKEFFSKLIFIATFINNEQGYLSLSDN